MGINKVKKFKINYYRLYNLIQKAYCFLPYNLGFGKAFSPIRYTFNITLRCNLSCKFCFIGNKLNLNELTTEEWLKIIDQVKPYNLITFTGGEVTLRSDFETLLKKSLSKAKVSLITNATLLNDELIKTCVDKKLFLMGVSIDGIGENHDSVRCVKGAFDKTINNLEKFKQIKGKRKFPLLDIKTVILNENLDELVKIYNLADELGADFYTLSFLKGCDLQFHPDLKNEFTEEFYNTNYPVQPYLDMEHFEDVYKQLMDISKKNKAKLRIYPEFELERSDKELNKIKNFYSKSNEMKVQDIYHPCLFPWTDMLILPNGDINPCLAYKVGNAKDNSLKEIWNNNKFQNFRIPLKKNKLYNSCQSCCYSRIKNDFTSS